LPRSLDEALALKARHPDWVALKDGPPAPGFDTVNSPGVLRSMDLGGRTVVQKTTNGTVGVHAVKECVAGAVRQFRGGGGNGSGSCGRAEATCHVRGHRRPTGRADEDLACAQYIARRAAEAGTDAAEFLRRAAESRAAADLADGVRRGDPGVHPDDVALCLEVDRFPFAMVATLEGPLMVLRLTSGANGSLRGSAKRGSPRRANR
jgi:2-phosphosulfolactate phosphatase